MKSTRCDLHLHSTASTQNEEWYTRYFQCPESYAEPLKQYELCKARGMSLVTLTDHDTIDGGLELIHLPDFFLSEEITTLFPENGCVVHVLAWNITPAQHKEIQRRRDDIYKLSGYLQNEKIAHGLAHPLLSQNWRLDATLMEKLLLLFPTMERINGLADARIHEDLTVLLEGLTDAALEKLSKKHSLPPNGKTPARKALTGGSDDHAYRHCAAVFTEVDGADLRPKSFLSKVMAGEGHPRGEPADITTMALGVHHVTYHYLQKRVVERVGYQDPFVDMVDVIAGRSRNAKDNADEPSGFLRSLLRSAASASLPVGEQLDVLHIPRAHSLADAKRVVEAIARLNDTMLGAALDELVAGVRDADVYRTLGALRDGVGALATALPYLFAVDDFGRQHQQSARVRESWTAYPLPPRRRRLAIFSDSIENTDGVAASCRRFLAQARRANKEVFVPYCAEKLPLVEDLSHFHRLSPVRSFPAVFYPMTLHLPSLLETIDWVWRQRITHIELSTPGPMGLVGLVVAGLLHLPVTASYHTEVPELLKILSGSDFLGKAAQRYLSWFYGGVDQVFAFSSNSRSRLLEMGVSPSKIELLPVSVDPDEFSPTHKTSTVFEALRIPVFNRPVILSVGRISPEKNLHLVIEAVGKLQHLEPAPLLVIVGDGPEKEDLEDLCAKRGYVYFTGMREGATLRQLYASSQLFVFASQVDTLGLSPMEALSSGLPVLLPKGASLTEFITPGTSALLYEFGLEGLTAGLQELLSNKELSAKLSTNGRSTMVERWQQLGFNLVWEKMVETRNF